MGIIGWHTLHVSFILKLDERIALVLLLRNLAFGIFIPELVDDDADLGFLSVICPGTAQKGQPLQDRQGNR